VSSVESCETVHTIYVCPVCGSWEIDEVCSCVVEWYISLDDYVGEDIVECGDCEYRCANCDHYFSHREVILVVPSTLRDKLREITSSERLSDEAKRYEILNTVVKYLRQALRYAMENLKFIELCAKDCMYNDIKTICQKVLQEVKQSIAEEEVDDG